MTAATKQAAPRCARYNCAVEEVELHDRRAGWLKCRCGEEWRASAGDISAAIADALAIKLPAAALDGQNSDVGAWMLKRQAEYRLLGQKHRDALEYQEHFRRAGQPAPVVDLRDMRVRP